MVSKEHALKGHLENGGKYEILSKVPLTTMEELATYYTPGVAHVCEAIKADKSKVFEYTTKANTIAIISDGTRILGLGDIGPEAGLPVMEGKAILFKKFGGVDAVPICVGTKDEDEIFKFVKWLAPTFGAVNIEDINSPKCFNLVKRLSESLDIPVFHDDQYGTAVVTLAGLLNAFKLAGKGKDARVVLYGAGAAGIGIARLLIHMGFNNVIVLDSKGTLYSGRKEDMNESKIEIASKTNPNKETGSIEQIAAKADALICSTGRVKLDKSIISRMNEKPILFALTNPDPEIEYDDAKAGGAYIAATGRSDSLNQVNNLIAFPGIMRGLLDVRAKAVTQDTLEAAARAIARCVGKRLGTEYIIPSFTDGNMSVRVASEVAEAVANSSVRQNLARIIPEDGEVKAHTKELLKRYSRIERRVVGR